MPLENLTGSNVFITNLVPTNPAGTDVVSEGDDHLRGTKNVLLNSFPAINGPVTATPVQLNQLAPAGGAEFTGIPTAPTAAPGTSTTQIASTEFVTSGIAAIPPTPSVGVDQTWQVLTGSRALSTDYTNGTGRPIMVTVCTETVTGNASLVASINGVEVARQQLASGGAITSITNISIIVPAGAVYRFTGATTLKRWAELR